MRPAECDDACMPTADRRVALVTGSSRGLGAVIARRLASDGFAVAVNGRRGDRQAEQVARGIRGDGSVAEAFCADITDEQQVAELIAAITGRFGPVDVLVLNATGPQPEAPVTEVGWAGRRRAGRPMPLPRTHRSAWPLPGPVNSLPPGLP